MRNWMYWFTMMGFATASFLAFKDAGILMWVCVSPWLVGAFIIAYLDKE